MVSRHWGLGATIVILAIAVLWLWTSEQWLSNFFTKSQIERSETALSLLGQDLPSVDLQTFEGDQKSIGSLLKEGRPSIIVLWATWCAPCVRELPVLEKFFESTLQPENINLLLVNYDGANPETGISEVKSWLAENDIHLETSFDFEGVLLSQLKIAALPFAVASNANGKIVWAHQGEVDWLESGLLENKIFK